MRWATPSTTTSCLGVNLYYMDYTDQFVQTGAGSDIGENLATNIKDSYRMGIELQAGIEPHRGSPSRVMQPWANSRSRISTRWSRTGTTGRGIHYDNSTLAFSPSTILNGFVSLHHKGLSAVWHTNFVSRQYLDNTENDNSALPCCSTSNVQLSYTLQSKRKPSCAFPTLLFKEVVFGLNFNNLIQPPAMPLERLGLFSHLRQLRPS